MSIYSPKRLWGIPGLGARFLIRKTQITIAEANRQVSEARELRGQRCVPCDLM